jgi:hypothetical protein
MLYHHISIVLAGAFAHFMTGWILNCNPLFSQFLHHDKKVHQGLSADLKINMLIQFLVSIALSLATCIAIYIFEQAHISVAPENIIEKFTQLFFHVDQTKKSMINSLYTVLFIWAGFILPSSFENVIWGGYSVRKWITDLSMEFIGLLAIATTVTYLA